MPRFTTVLQTKNEALRVARAIESLRACDDVLIIDQSSTDEIIATAKEFGARIVMAASSDFASYLHQARHDWILALRPTEAVGESLEASLYEFAIADIESSRTFAISFLEETEEGWKTSPAETRLVHRSHRHWNVGIPHQESSSVILEGYLLRLRLP